MDSDAIESLQRKWVEQLTDDTQGLTIIATDGKTMRSSGGKEMNQKARHIVSLFLTESKLTLTQNQVDEKSNEIPALISLLDNLNLKNCVITMERCILKKTLNKIVKKGHDYVVQVKGNSKELLKWVDFNTTVNKEPLDECITYDHNTHGRHEKRIC